MALKVVLDTNRYSDFARGDDAVRSILEFAESIYLPFVVVAELRAGFSAGTRGAANEAFLENFLHEKDVQVLYPDDQTIASYASAFKFLRLQGKKIPANDLWVAAIVLQHGLTLCTRDAHFDHLPHIPRA